MWLNVCVLKSKETDNITISEKQFNLRDINLKLRVITIHSRSNCFHNICCDLIEFRKKVK